MVLQKSWLPDVRNIPCARSALIHGILGGLTVGLLYFAKSSECHHVCVCVCVIPSGHRCCEEVM